MAVTVTVADGDDADVAAGRAVLAADAAERLGVTTGDTVTVRGSDETAVVVEVRDDGSGTVLLAESTRTNAGVAVGESATVAGASRREATAVTVAPTSEFRVRVGADTVRSYLAGVPVTTGDRFRASLVGGSITIPFRVTAVEPASPATVVETTDVTIETPETGGPTTATPTATLEDVGGLDETVRAVSRAVLASLRHPELADRFDGRTAGGVLLTGPSGTGKTLLVEAVANEADATLVRVADPATVRGSGERNLDEVVRTAREQAPSIVFFDDLDTLAPGRDDGNASEARATRRVADAVDRLASLREVVVMGATNRLDAVDDSLRRGGRFDREIELPTPDPDDRRAILRIHTAGLPLGEDVDLAGLADRTHGFVGADLEALVTTAVQATLERIPGSYIHDREPIPEAVLDEATVTAADFETALGQVVPSGMRRVAMERPEIGYGDIGGLDAVKTTLVRAVEWPLLYPELFEQFGSTPPAGVLLYGPPGTGKTMLAKAVASSTDANFITVNGPELLNRYVGESERGVREVFERARQHAPTIVFFDEVDAIAKTRRDDGGDTGVTERVVSQLLTELDGMERRDGVFVVAATNRPDMVDPALLRPGRLEKLVEVPLPDRDARREILAVHTRSVPLGDVDLDAVADRTDGFNGSDIEALVREATLLAMDDHLRDTGFEPSLDGDPPAVESRHFERALGSVEPSVSADRREYYADVDSRL